MAEKVFKTPYCSTSSTPKFRNRFRTPTLSSNSGSEESLTSENGSSDPNLSIIAEYDELIRFTRTIKSQYTHTEKFTQEFVENAKLLFQSFQTSREECLRLQKRLDVLARENTDLEGKLAHARKLLDREKKNTKMAERERDIMVSQITNLKDALRSDKDILKGIPEHTLSKFAFLETDRIDEEQAPHLSCIPEINSTGSLLSDFSYSKSEDNLDVSRIDVGKSWKKHRPSTDAAPEQPAMKKRRSGSNKIVEISTTDTVRATTTLTMPKSGPITATSIIEALPCSSKVPNYEPSAPPVTPLSMRTMESDLQYHQTATLPSDMIFQSWARKEGPPKPSRTRLDNCFNNNNNNNNNYSAKQHAFQKKTVVLPENCGFCQNRLKFGRLAWKCKDCKHHCHEECKEKLPVPCIPVIHTPNRGGGFGVISDYTGTTPPLVPALILHCVNEIELRDSREIGLYRVPGSEKDVKTLKDRLLRGKAAPSLRDVDIHVLCGVVKDFLRSLQEPLITRAFWKDFVSAADTNNVQLVKDRISELPQSNRDTLAYMILHLQRIAENKDIKMPVDNLAIVFGPTIVGYFSEDFDDKNTKSNFVAEAKQQINAMKFLLSLPSSYWESFVNVTPSYGHAKLQQTPSTDSLLLRSNRGQTATPKKRKIFPTPPQYRY